jgi:hypothetical protein
MPPKITLDRNRKLLLQSVALLSMMLTPVFLYVAALAGATASIYGLLGVMTAAMLLSIVIS